MSTLASNAVVNNGDCDQVKCVVRVELMRARRSVFSLYFAFALFERLSTICAFLH